MNVTVRANCECCGDFKTTPKEVVVRFVDGEKDERYYIDCPKCDTGVVKEAESETIDFLVRHGAKSETWASLIDMKEYDRIKTEFKNSLEETVTILEFKDYLETNDLFSDLYAETREQMLRNEAGFEAFEHEPYNDGPAGDIKNV